MIEFTDPHVTYATREELGRPWGCSRDQAELWWTSVGEEGRDGILLSRCYDRLPVEKCLPLTNPIMLSFLSMRMNRFHRN